jgi:ankyrin repeat protein
VVAASAASAASAGAAGANPKALIHAGVLALQVNCTPLHYAACHENTAVMQKLLKGGARIDAADLVNPCPPLQRSACRSIVGRMVAGCVMAK